MTSYRTNSRQRCADTLPERVKFECSAANVEELFSTLDQQFPDLKPHLRDDAGQIRRFLNVYVNEEDIRFLGGNCLCLSGRRRGPAGAVDRGRCWVTFAVKVGTRRRFLRGRRRPGPP